MPREVSFIAGYPPLSGIVNACIRKVEISLWSMPGRVVDDSAGGRELGALSISRPILPETATLQGEAGEDNVVQVSFEPRTESESQSL
jgi:hypothetical protein